MTKFEQPYNERYNTLYTLCKIYDIENPWRTDKYYEIRALDTMTFGPRIHLFADEELSTTFTYPFITIKYSIKTIPQALIHLYIRISEIELDVVNTTLKIGEKFEFKCDPDDDYEDSLPHLELLFQECVKATTFAITINLPNLVEFEAQQTLLIYPVTAWFEDSYFLDREYARWLKAKQ